MSLPILVPSASSDPPKDVKQPMSSPGLIWNAPSGRRLVAKIHGELAAGRNTVCYLPKGLLKDNFLQALSDRLYYGGLGRLELPNGPRRRPEGGADPEIADLASLLKSVRSFEETGLSSRELETASLEELFEAAANDDRLRFLALPDLEGFPEPVQRTLAEDLRAWAAFAQRRRSAGREPTGLRLMVLVSPLFPLLREEPLLSVQHWWAKTDDVDDRTVFDHLAELGGLEPSALALYWWLKALCEGFCRDDLVLMEIMLMLRPKTVEGIKNAMALHPLSEVAGRYRERVALQPPLRPLRLGEKPPLPTPPLYRELWAEGLLTARRGATLHPLLMDDEALVKTIGAGQRQVFLPLVDHMQSFLLTTLEAYFDPYVWEQYEPDEDLRAAVISEISPMYYFIQNKLPVNQRFVHNAKMRAMSFAFSWRKIRNIVAHNKTIEYADLALAFGEYDAFFDLAVKFLEIRHLGGAEPGNGAGHREPSPEKASILRRPVAVAAPKAGVRKYRRQK